MELIKIITTLEDGPVCPKLEFGIPLTEVGDNRKRILRANGIEPSQVIRMDPTHRDMILVIDDEIRDIYAGRVFGRNQNDAFITRLPNVALECDPGDCGVYILFNGKYNILSLVHAGREGSFKRILEKTIVRGAEIAEKSVEDYVKELKVIMAPAICGNCYGLDYLNMNDDELINWIDYIKGGFKAADEVNKIVPLEEGKKIGLDFIGFNKQKLLELGVKPKNMDISDICAYESSLYPSYHRHLEKGTPDGRFMVLGMMKES